MSVIQHGTGETGWL